jgi:hypothetical protein
LGRKASSSTAEAEKVHRERQAAAAAAAAQQAQHEQEQQAQQAQQQAQQAHQSKAKSKPSNDIWVCYHTAEGKPYYHNERTGNTVWVLPAGDGARYPDGTPIQGSSYQADDDDPFAHLRKQEEEMRQQREYWSQWYAQYSAWYAQQGGQQAQSSTPSKEPPSFGERSSHKKAQSSATGSNAGTNTSGATGPGYNPFYEDTPGGPNPSVSAPARGPPPPRLLAGVEDHTIYAIKSAILKEMEQMVDQAKAIAQRKKALRCLQMRWHPDKNPDKIEVSKSVFQFIEEIKPWFLFDPDGAQDNA